MIYRRFEIVIDCKDDKCKGKAWAKIPGYSNIELECDGQQITEVKLKKAIDEVLQPRTEARLQTLSFEHSEYLARIGKPDKGIRKPILERHDSYCYSCGEPVNTDVDMICKACRWVVCHECAACGCGHEKFLPPRT